MDSRNAFLSVFALLVVLWPKSGESCNCMLRSGENLNEPLIIRSYCYDDFAWKVFVRSEKSDIEFKDSKNVRYNRYDVRVTKVYKDSRNTSVFSDGFVYTPGECAINLTKTRFVVMFGYYDRTDGKPVVSECTFAKLIDDLNVGERLFLMGAYRRIDCQERHIRPPGPGSPGMPGVAARPGFPGPPFIPALPGFGGIGGTGGLPGIGAHGILGGAGGPGGNGGTALGTGMGGPGGSGGPGGQGTMSKTYNRLEYTKDLAALNLTEVSVETETKPTTDGDRSDKTKAKIRSKRVKRDETEAIVENAVPVVSEDQSANEAVNAVETEATTSATEELAVQSAEEQPSDEQTVDAKQDEQTATDAQMVPALEFGAPAHVVLPTAKPGLPHLPPKDKALKGFKDDKIRWPMGKPGGNQQGWGNQGAHAQDGYNRQPHNSQSPDFNLCSIPSLQDLPQCSQHDWEANPSAEQWTEGEAQRPRKKPSKQEWTQERPPKQTKPPRKPNADSDWSQSSWQSWPNSEKPSRPSKPVQTAEHGWDDQWDEKPTRPSKHRPPAAEPEWNEWSEPPPKPSKPKPEAEWSEWQNERPKPSRPKPESEWSQWPNDERPGKPGGRPKPEPDWSHNQWSGQQSDKPAHRPKPSLPEPDYPEWNEPDAEAEPEKPSRPRPEPEWSDWPEKPAKPQKPGKPEPEWWPQGPNWPGGKPKPDQDKPVRPAKPRPDAGYPGYGEPEADGEWAGEWAENSVREPPIERPPKSGKKPKTAKQDSYSCSCNRLRQLEESCSATFADTMTKFFAADSD